MAASGALVGFEIFQPDEVQRYAIHRNHHAPRIRRCKFQAVDASQQVYPSRRVTQLDHVVFCRQVHRFNPERAKSKGFQRSKDPLRVGGIGANPEIQIARIARMTESGQRVTVDDQVLNLV